MPDAQKKDQNEIISSESYMQNGTLLPADDISEVALDRFFVLSLELMVIADTDGSFRQVNPAFEAALGWSLEDLSATPFITLIHPDDVKTTLAVLKTLTETKEPTEFENRVLCQDGSYKYLSWSAQATPDNLIYAVARDITERHEQHQQQETMLEYRTRQMETSIEVTQEISSAADLDELFSKVAERLRSRFEYYGVNVYTLEENRLVLQAGTSDVARNIERVGYTISLESDGYLSAHAARTGEPQLVSDLTQQTDWLLHPFLPESRAVIAVPIKLKNQVLGVIDIHSDVIGGITEEDHILLLGLCGQIAIAIDQHHTEAERIQVEAELRESEERFRQVISSISGHVYMAEIRPDSTRINLYVAPNVLGLTGYALEHFVDDGSFWAERVVHPDDRPIIEGQSAVLLDGKSGNFNYRLVRADGRTIWVNDSTQVVEDTRHQRQIIYGVVTEITEHKETAGALAEALAEAQILYEVSQVVSNITKVEDGLAGILYVLNQNQVALQTSLINVTNVIPDESGEPEWLEVMAWHIPDNRETPYPVGNRYSVAENSYIKLWVDDPTSPIFLENIHTDARLEERLRDLYLKMGTASSVLMPLSLAGQWIGLLSFGWAEPQQFTDLDRRVYRSLRHQFSVALNNYRLTSRMQVALSDANVFRQLAESSGQGIGMATLQADITYMNPTLAKILGEERPENTYAKKILSYYPPEMQQRLEHEVLPTVLADGQWVGELALRSTTGQITPTIENFFLIRDQDGTPLFLADVVIDISNLKETENTLAKRAVELETVAQVSAAASNILDIDQLLDSVVNLTKESFNLYHTHIYLLNEAEDTLVLRSGAGDVGKQMVAEGREIPLNRAQSLVARSARERKGILVNNVQADPGFLPHPLLPKTRAEIAVPMVVGNKTIGVIDVQADSVDRFTEEDLNIQATLAAQIAIAVDNARLIQRTETSLREVQRLATIVENQTDFMGVCDMDGNLLYINPGGRTILGLTDQADISQLAISDFLAHNDIRQLMEVGIPAAIEGGSWLLEMTLRKRDGSSLPVELSITVNQDAHGQPYSFNIVMHDISERKVAEEEQKRLVAEVEATIRQFVEREWTAFLDGAHDGSWNVEHNQMVDSDRVISSKMLNELQDQAMHEGEVTLSSADLAINDQSNAIMVTPIPLRGQIIGTLALEDIDPGRKWTENDMALVQAVSEQLAFTIENLRLFDDVQQFAHREKIVADMTQHIWASGDLEKVMQTAVSELGEKFDASEVVIKLGAEYLDDADTK